MRVLDDNGYRDETPEEIAEREAWKREHPVDTTPTIEEQMAAANKAIMDIALKVGATNV